MGEKTSIEEILKVIVDEFNRKIENNKELFERIKDLERSILVKISEEGVYIAKLKGGRLTYFERAEEVPCQIRIETDRETFIKLVNREISPMIAYTEGLVKFKAPLRDMLLLKDLFS